MHNVPTTPFRWPPQTPPPQSPSSDSTEKPDDPAPRQPSIWRELAELWLAPTAPPLSVRIEESGWKPDPPGTWCDRCATTVGPYEENEFGCSECRGKRLPYDRAVRLGEFTGDLREWIHEVKFTRFRALGVGLGRLLAKQLRTAGVPTSDILICPMPTSWRRRVTRGTDHAAAIARGVSIELNAPLARLLKRQHRPSQQSLPASKRRRNVIKSFSSRRQRLDITQKYVILIDDVRTTGSTALAAAKAIRTTHKPTSIWLAVLAAAPRPGSEETTNPQLRPHESITTGTKKRIEDDTCAG